MTDAASVTRLRPGRPAAAAALALALALGPAAAPAAGATLEGERFAKTVRLDDTPLRLYDLALMRYRWVFKVYVAALYLEEGVPAARVLEDVPKRLEIAYFRGFEAAQFRRATVEGIRRNVDAAAFARLEPAIEALNALYRDVQPGDRYAIEYAPGAGTALLLNGEPLGRVEGAAMARAVFSIWLGDEPFDADLKAALLDGV